MIFVMRVGLLSVYPVVMGLSWFCSLMVIASKPILLSSLVSFTSISDVFCVKNCFFLLLRVIYRRYVAYLFHSQLVCLFLFPMQIWFCSVVRSVRCVLFCLFGLLSILISCSMAPDFYCLIFYLVRISHFVAGAANNYDNVSIDFIYTS